MDKKAVQGLKIAPLVVVIVVFGYRIARQFWAPQDASMRAARDVPDGSIRPQPEVSPPLPRPPAPSSSIALSVATRPSRSPVRTSQNAAPANHDLVLATQPYAEAPAAATDLDTLPADRIGYQPNLPRIESDPLLAPTRVSLHLHDVSVQEAFDQLARQANWDVRTDPGSPFDSGPTSRVTIDGEGIPLCEALMRLYAQTPLRIVSASGSSTKSRNTILVSLPRQRQGVGIWSNSGAFAFEVKRVTQTIEFWPPSKQRNGFVMEMQWMAEPRLMVIARPSAAYVRSAVDDNGASMVQGNTVNVDRTGLIPMSFRLTPAAGASRIVHLGAVAHVMVATDTETVIIPRAEATTQPITFGDGHYQLAVTTALTPAHNWFDMTIDFKPVGRVSPQWNALKSALHGARILLAGPTRGAVVGMGIDPPKPLPGAPDHATFVYRWDLPRNDPDDVRHGTIFLEIARDVRIADLPIELVNLPVP